MGKHSIMQRRDESEVSRMFNMKKAVWVVVLLLAFGCGEDKVVNNYYNDNSAAINGIEGFLTVTPAKWYNNHGAAVSLNFDIRWRGEGRDEANDTMVGLALEKGFKADIELVTANYTEWPGLVDEMHSVMEPRGVRFFGHGHNHDNHDSYDFDYCLDSFVTCYNYMKDWDFIPRTYAYPHWAGRNATTQAANELAGFIAARGREDDLDNVYICPGAKKAPDNWYYMPSAAAGDMVPYIMNHDVMGGVIEGAVERNAYLIITYHSIGYPQGWGYYPLEDYKQDLDTIAAHDFWAGNMDDVVCYIMERNAFKMEASIFSTSENMRSYTVSFKDGLDNTVFAQPLTLELACAESSGIDSLSFEPPINGKSVYVPESGTVSFNVLPDERKYRLTLFCSEREN